MNVLDANVLIALYRPDHEHHVAARTWWQDAVRRGETFAVPDESWMGFLRVVTTRSIYQESARLADAWEFVRSVTGHPQALRHVPGPHTLSHCEKASSQAGLAGRGLTDAYIAAIAMEYGATVVTFDRDFRKFDNLRVTELA